MSQAGADLHKSVGERFVEPLDGEQRVEAVEDALLHLLVALDEAAQNVERRLERLAQRLVLALQ